MAGDGLLYNLELTMRGCKVIATLNNLPLVNSDAKAGASFGSPLNSKLIGKDNQLKIVALPTLLESGAISKAADVVLNGTIKVYGVNDISAPENGKIVRKFDFNEVIAERRQKLLLEKKAAGLDSAASALEITLPLELQITFDNEGPAFQNRFVQGPIIKDEKHLLDYAERLRDLLKSRAIDKLFNEFKPKFEDYNIAYHRGNLDRRPAFTEYLKEKFFPNGPLLNFDRDDICLKSWCSGRVWEIFIKPDRPFLMTAGMGDEVYEMEIFVALVNGELKVIR